MKPVFDISPKPAPEPVFYGGKGAGIAAALKQQQADSAAVPVIVSPPPPTTKDIGPQSLNYQRLTIPASGPGKVTKYPVQVKGDFIYIEGITYATDDAALTASLIGNVTLITDTLQTPVLISEAYREIRFPVPYNYIEITNGSYYNVTLTVWTGFGMVRRDRNANKTRLSQVATPNNFGGVVAKNHHLTGKMTFWAATSVLVQSAMIRSAQLTSVFNNGNHTWDMSLWLFAKPPPDVFSNDPFLYYTLNYGRAANVLGKIDFANPSTGDTNSDSATSFQQNLSIPIFSDQAEQYPSNLNERFTIYGYVITNANYTSAPFPEQWEVDLFVEYS